MLTSCSVTSRWPCVGRVLTSCSVTSERPCEAPGGVQAGRCRQSGTVRGGQLLRGCLKSSAPCLSALGVNLGNALRSAPSPAVSLGSFLRPLWVLAALHLAGFPLPFVAVRVVPQFPFVAEALITHRCFG